MRIEVVAGDLQGALKRWRIVATENRSAMQHHQWYMAPSERRKRKERKANQRRRRRLYGRH